MSSTNQSNVQLYNKAINFKLNEKKLQINGFPRPTSTPGKAIIYTKPPGQPQRGNIRKCIKCSKDYNVDQNGFQTNDEICVYHFKRLCRNVLYPCCDGNQFSAGCCQARCHVHEYMDHQNLQGFVQTKPSCVDSKNHQIFAVDCEMSYTTQGMETTKVTVVDTNRNIAYETHVKPSNPIVEYNEKFSGVNEEIMSVCTTTLEDVHGKLLDMFSDKSILVGHSLNADLKYLKLIHSNVIDTSLLYPHKNPQFKKALKTLAKEKLNRIIQDPNKCHNSSEDALACMDLLILKLK